MDKGVVCEGASGMPGGVPFGREPRAGTGRPKGALLYGLRRARIEGGLTTRELAGVSGVSHSTINFLENGRRGARPETIHSLARALGIAKEELIGEECGSS